MISLKINEPSHQYTINQDFGESDVLITILPVELLLEIFSYLNLAVLGVSCRVSKEQKQLAREPILWKRAVYQEIAFSHKKWELCFGKEIVKDEDSEEEFSSLPSDIAEILKSPCPAFPGKKVIESHMLVRIPKTIYRLVLTLFVREDDKGESNRDEEDGGLA